MGVQGMGGQSVKLRCQQSTCYLLIILCSASLLITLGTSAEKSVPPHLPLAGSWPHFQILISIALPWGGPLSVLKHETFVWNVKCCFWRISAFKEYPHYNSNFMSTNRNCFIMVNLTCYHFQLKSEQNSRWKSLCKTKIGSLQYGQDFSRLSVKAEGQWKESAQCLLYDFNFCYCTILFP